MPSKSRAPTCLRFAGVSLAGGKTHKTAVAIIEYYPEHEKLFVRSAHAQLGATKDGATADFNLHHLLSVQEKRLKFVALNAPLGFPKCVTCELICPGYEKCKEPEIKWLWQLHDKADADKKRPRKTFTPYTERCVDSFLSNEMGEIFHTDHALGANRAPLAARAHYVTRRLRKLRFIEFYPRLTLWQVGRKLGVQKSYLQFYRHSQDSDQGRMHFLMQLVERNWLFLYQQDLKLAVEDPQVFEAILGGLTGFLKFRKQTASPPEGFPENESWVDYPLDDLEWFPPASKRRAK